MSDYRNLIIQSPYDFAIFEGELKNSLLFYDKIIIPDFQKAFSDPINSIRNRPVTEFVLMWKLLGEADESEIYKDFNKNEIKELKKNADKLYAPFAEAEKVITMLTAEGLTSDHEFETINSIHGDKWLKAYNKNKEFKKNKNVQEKLNKDTNVVWFLQDQAILELAEKERHTTFYRLTEPELFYEEPIFESSFPNNIENLFLSKCDFQIPDFQRVSFDDVLEIRRKHSDELSQARTHLAKLAFDIATKFKNEPTSELNKWIDYYSTNIIKPQIKAFVHSVKKDKGKTGKKILKSVAGFASFVLSLTNWKSLLPELIKTGLELNENLSSNNTQEQSFIKCIGLTYEKANSL